MYDKQYHSIEISTSSFLVTGGSGFIGSNIVEYLVKNNAGKIRMLDNYLTSSKQILNLFYRSQF
jgi:UDP-N-acetylglucosamine 4-epimerase